MISSILTQRLRWTLWPLPDRGCLTDSTSRWAPVALPYKEEVGARGTQREVTRHSICPTSFPRPIERMGSRRWEVHRRRRCIDPDVRATIDSPSPPSPMVSYAHCLPSLPLWISLSETYSSVHPKQWSTSPTDPLLDDPTYLHHVVCLGANCCLT
jgi:hypothetical protein